MSLRESELSQFKSALKNGYAQTPMSHDLRPSEDERDDQISIIARVVTAQYNTHPDKPILHWKTIFFRVQEIIKTEKSLGLWKHKIPEIEAIRRSINYSADKRRFPNDLPPAICTTAGNYCFNPSKLLDPETKAKLLAIINAAKVQA